MAQLKQDEWPMDGEPTTTEEEGDAVKGRGPGPAAKGRGEAKADVRRQPRAVVIDTVEPDQQVE